MKIPGFFAVAAASATAAATTITASSSSSSSSLSFNVSIMPPLLHQEEVESNGKDVILVDNPSNSANEEKFAPRFDGLRFIETLITAHR